MKLLTTGLILAVSCKSLSVSGAQLEIAAEKNPPSVFGGNTKNIALLWRNPGETMIEADVHMRVVQLTSATAVHVNELPWKKLQILAGQTLVESAPVPFPEVKGKTRFLVQWVQNTNRVIGSTEVLAYPTNLLSELQPLVGHQDGALGVFDPRSQLKPLLKNAKVQFLDLGDMELEKFRGKLAIIGPFESRIQVNATLVTKIKTIAQKGVAVVWLQPPCEDSSAQGELPKPSFYSVPENQTAAVIIQSYLVSNLADNPRSQLNLVYFCKIALHPRPLTLPSFESQP